MTFSSKFDLVIEIIRNIFYGILSNEVFSHVILANLIFYVKSTRMIRRNIEKHVRAALQRQAAVALIGPRQVGKTTLALKLGEARP